MCFWIAVFDLQAQSDTLRITTYNLLNYGNTTTYCTSSNNDIGTKDGYLKTVLQHLQPDVLMVNEMGCNTVYRTRILQNALNIGTSKYKGATLFMRSSQDICNALFYNSDKLEVTYEEGITQDGSSYMTRAAGLYHFTYKSPGLQEHKDSSGFWIVTTHLKAGNTSGDAATRGMEAEIIMKKIAQHPAGNFLIGGDFNLYRSSEDAWTQFTAPTSIAHKLRDPINKAGVWNNNSTYAAYHTQSTVASGTACQSGGGMDDRFDIILASDAVISGTQKMKFIPGTYSALGQDGNRFNQSIDNPTNNTIPAPLANALAKMSDHLPVSADFSLAYTKTTVGMHVLSQERIEAANPYEALFFFGLKSPADVRIYDLQGRLQLADKALPGTPIAQHLPRGIYLVEVVRGQHAEFHKWVKP